MYYNYCKTPELIENYELALKGHPATKGFSDQHHSDEIKESIRANIGSLLMEGESGTKCLCYIF